MKRIETAIDVAAPPELVWEALTDFVSYPRWNPPVREIDGEARLGAQLRLLVVAPDGNATRLVRLPARIVELEPGRALAWVGGLAPIFRGRHGFRLSPTARGTRLEHSEAMSGVFPLLYGPAYLARLTALYEAMNRGLAEQARLRSWRRAA